MLAVALAAFGAARLVREALDLKARVERYLDLPLRTDIALASGRLQKAERAIDQIPVLTARYERAVAEIDTARKRVAMMSAMLVKVLRRQFRV